MSIALLEFDDSRKYFSLHVFNIFSIWIFFNRNNTQREKESKDIEYENQEDTSDRERSSHRGEFLTTGNRLHFMMPPNMLHNHRAAATSVRCIEISRQTAQRSCTIRSFI